MFHIYNITLWQWTNVAVFHCNNVLWPLNIPNLRTWECTLMIWIHIVFQTKSLQATKKTTCPSCSSLLIFLWDFHRPLMNRWLARLLGILGCKECRVESFHPHMHPRNIGLPFSGNDFCFQANPKVFAKKTKVPWFCAYIKNSKLMQHWI